MKIVKVGLQGGLGNQLFQFANGASVALANNSKIQFSWIQSQDKKTTPRSYSLDFLGIKLNANYEISIKDKKLEFQPDFEDIDSSNSRIFAEKQFHYVPIPTFKEDVLELSGYFQSSKYFQDLSEETRNTLNLNLGKISKGEKESLSNLDFGIHMRFGDFKSNLKNRMNHGVMSIAYFENACKILEDQGFQNSMVVSDSFIDAGEYCSKIKSRNVLQSPKSNGDPLMDLRGLSLLDGLIGSNSSFSWWAAFLGGPHKTVIMPKRYFAWMLRRRTDLSDLYEPNWLAI